MSEDMRQKFADTVKPVSDVVTNRYQKVEDTVVSGYKKIEDAFIERYFTKEKETVEDAKLRLNQAVAKRKNEHRIRKIVHNEFIKQRKVKHKAKI